MPEMTLRALRADDAADVLAAFDSDPSMARQGTVTTVAEADAYIYGLLDPSGNNHPFAICDGDRLVAPVRGRITVYELFIDPWSADLDPAIIVEEP